MIVVVFRTRMRSPVDPGYEPMARQMSELARHVPGYISHKGYTAEDGERVTVVEFASEEALERWRTHPDHLKAKRHGYTAFFQEFRFQICQVLRTKSWASSKESSSREHT